MSIILNISSEQERALRAAWGSGLDAAALEALAIEGYRLGKLTPAELRVLLGLKDRWEVNQWLAARKVPLHYSQQDLEHDADNFDRLPRKTG